jgi:sigma-B regulation protein RsbU (phosphoserine phosphatase)
MWNTGHKPTVLVVDDAPENLHVIVEALKNDYAILTARDGAKALQLVRGGKLPDIILLDVVMPGMDGYEVCRALKDDSTTREIPVIFVTSLAESQEEALGLTMGAVDYITKPFNPAILKARLANHLALRRAYRDLQRSQAVLAEELAQAAQYVASLLPVELPDGPVRANWRFVPSSSLGGDAFGYHFPDDRHFAFYLLDVCSHGVGPALLSVQVLHVLHNQSIPSVDFLDPAQVLAGLNDLFQMDRHNALYFTMVYGILDSKSRQLTLANAGHPPPLCFGPDGKMLVLRKPNLLIGAMPGVGYKNLNLTVEPGTSLYLFSDGVYEVQQEDGTYCTYTEFATSMSTIHCQGGDVLDAVLAQARRLGGTAMLKDDFSLLKLQFP